MQVMLDRRTFLKAIGAGAAVTVVVPAVLAQAQDSSPATDPILAQASALDFDRDRIHRFVADEIAYEPYAGVLRGAATTLAGRAGNGADKAVLLAALLNAAFIETRFATGTLSDEAAATLAATTVDRHATFGRAEAALRAGVPETSGTAIEPDPAVEAILDRMPEIDASVAAWASEAIDTSVRTITEALADAGLTLPAGVSPLPDTERTRHLWVQARSGSEWVDLDPTVPGTQPGVTIATVAGGPLTGVPDDLRHRIDIDLVLEKVVGAGVTQEAIIEHTAFADELTDVSIAIGHAKPQALKQLGAGIEALIAGGTRYLAVLQMGSMAYVGLSPLILSGDEGAEPSGGIDVFGPTGTGAREGEAVAEWLELRITSPDATVSTARRTLFDRIGEEARLAGPVDPAAVRPVELVDLDADHPDEFLPLAIARFLSVATGAKAWPSADLPEGQEALALGIPVQMYHVARDATNANLSLPRGVAIHLAAPNVTMHAYAPALGPDGSVSSVTETLDLLHRGFGALPVAGTTAVVPAGLLAGITSHVAERLRGGAGLPADLALPRTRVSVGALFEQAAADGIALRVLEGSVPGDLDYPQAASTLLAEALSEGWVAIAPARPVTLGGRDRIGWWLVNPSTGAARDQLDDGRGATMVEYTEVFAWSLFAALNAFILIGECLKGTMGVVELRLSFGLASYDVALCG